MSMALKPTEHPLLVYLTFVLPAVLLVLGLMLSVSVFLLILVIAWLGAAFVILYLPVESDNGSSG